MTVVIMHPKHNLELMYKNGEEHFLFPQASAAVRLTMTFSDQDVINAFLFGKKLFWNIILPYNDFKCKTNCYNL